MEANKLRQQQSEQAKQRKLKQYAEQAKDQRKGSGVVEEGIRRRMAEADAEKQRKLEQYKEIGKVMSAAYHAGEFLLSVHVWCQSGVEWKYRGCCPSGHLFVTNTCLQWPHSHKR